MNLRRRLLVGGLLGLAVLAGAHAKGNVLAATPKIEPGVVVKVVVSAEGCRRGLPERPSLQVKWFLDTSKVIAVASLTIVGPGGEVVTETHEGLDEGFRRSLEAETQQGAHRIMLELETADGDEMHLDAGFAVNDEGCGVLRGNRLYVGNLSMHTSD
jgi:hypothetical protein